MFVSMLTGKTASRAGFDMSWGAAKAGNHVPPPCAQRPGEGPENFIGQMATRAMWNVPMIIWSNHSHSHLGPKKRSTVTHTEKWSWLIITHSRSLQLGGDEPFTCPIFKSSLALPVSTSFFKRVMIDRPWCLCSYWWWISVCPYRIFENYSDVVFKCF